MLKLTDIASDPSAQDEGVWIEMPDGWRAKIRSTENPDCKALQNKHLRKNRNYYLSGGITPLKVQEQQTLDVVVETLLVDWEGIGDEKGKPIPYNKTMAREILGDRRYKRLLDQILQVAGESETYRAAALTAAEKNS